MTALRLLPLHARGGARFRADSWGRCLIDRYLNDAIEVDVDCICDGRRASIVAGRDGAYRGGGHPFGGQRLLPAALFPVARHRSTELRGTDGSAGAARSTSSG